MTRAWRVRLRFVLLATISVFLLACSGFVKPADWGEELASVDLTTGDSFEIRVEGQGKPLTLWLDAQIKSEGNGYGLYGPLQVRNGEQRKRMTVELTDEGVRFGKPGEPSTSGVAEGVGSGIYVRKLKVMVLDPAPKGEVVILRGSLMPLGSTTLPRARLVLTN